MDEDMDTELRLSGGMGDEEHVFRALLLHHSISQGCLFILLKIVVCPLPLHSVSHPFPPLLVFCL